MFTQMFRNCYMHNIWILLDVEVLQIVWEYEHVQEYKPSSQQDSSRVYKFYFRYKGKYFRNDAVLCNDFSIKPATPSHVISHPITYREQPAFITRFMWILFLNPPKYHIHVALTKKKYEKTECYSILERMNREQE